MQFTIHQLQIFLTVVKTRSITKAAALLNLSQPAASVQLKKFQEQFDISLIEMIGKKLQTTPFGKEVAQIAQNILNEVEEVKYKASSHKGKLSGMLRISVVSNGKYVIPYYLSPFLKLHQGVEIQMDVTNRNRVIENLEQNEVDFALMSILPNDMDVECEYLCLNQLYLVAGSNAQVEKCYNIRELMAKNSFIFRESGSGTRITIDNYFKSNKVDLKRRIQLTSNEAVKQAVMAGMGVSILPLISIKNELKLGLLQTVPFPEFPLESSWNLVYPKNKNLSPVSSAFLQFIQKEKNQIYQEFFSLT